MGTEAKRAFIIKIVYYVIVVGFSVAVLKYGVPMLLPFVIAFLIASVLHRPTLFLARKFHLPYKLTAFFLVLLFYATAGTLITLLVLRLITLIGQGLTLLPHVYYEHLLPALESIFLNIESFVAEYDVDLVTTVQYFGDQLLTWLGGFISRASSWAVGTASVVATSIPGLFIKFVLLLISSFFFAIDYDKLMGFCMKQLSDKGRELFYQIKKYVVGTLLVCIGSYIVVMSITFVELSIGLSIIGIKHAVLIALCIAIFDILPVLGTGGIMIPWAVIMLLRGDIKLGISLLAVYVVITIVRNIVEPKLVGSQLGLHPVVTLSSMFAGAQLFGVVGLFGFPIGLSLLMYLNNNGTIHIFKKENEV